MTSFIPSSVFKMTSKSNNFTTEPSYMDHLGQADWIAPMVVNICALIFDVWCFISLAHYGIVSGKLRRNRLSNSSELDSGLVYISVVVCSFLCICFTSVNLAYMNVGFYPGKLGDDLCNALGDANSCFYFLIIITNLSFQWLRQRTFYSNRMLNVNYSKTVRVFSTAAIFIILVVGTGIIVFYLFPYDYKASTIGCTYKPNDIFRLIYLASIVFGIIFGQITLFGLFLYALSQTKDNDQNLFFFILKIFLPSKESNESRDLSRKRSVFMNSVSHTEDSNRSTLDKRVRGNSFATPRISRRFSRSSCSRSRSIAIQLILRKTFVFSFLSIIADIFIQFLINYIIDPDDHRRLSVMVGNFNTSFTLLCLILSFVQYLDMLASPCRVQQTN